MWQIVMEACVKMLLWSLVETKGKQDSLRWTGITFHLKKPLITWSI
jgi:hypothetical protein